MCDVSWIKPEGITVELTMAEAEAILDHRTADPVAYRQFRQKVTSALARKARRDRRDQPPKSAQEAAYDLANTAQ